MSLNLLDMGTLKTLLLLGFRKSRIQDCVTLKVKIKVKRPYLTRIARDSN